MKKVLIIEDEAPLRKALEYLFKDEGFEVTSAADGETGLKLAQGIMPDLTILDILLPKMDGISVLNLIRSDPKTKDLSVLVLSNMADEETMSKIMEAGGRYYLVKSNYSIDDVLAKAREILREAGK